MADYISAISQGGTTAENLNVDDVQTWSNGPSKDTGDLRRKFNFGAQVSELAIAQDPFFRFVSKVSKRSTDDPAFKFTEKRPSYHKRYCYVVSHGTTSAASTTDPTIVAGNVDAGDTYYVKFGTDYKNTGNIGVVYNNSNASNFQVGDTNTQPSFLVPDQLIKLNYRAAAEASAFYTPTGYLVGKIKSTTSSGNYIIAELEIVKGTSSSVDFIGSSATVLWTASTDTHDLTVSSQLEVARCYVVGTAHSEGSGYPETWKAQPYSTGFGLTQIWKTSMAMTNTARATVLKYEPNEWARVWKEKLVEHKYEVEQSLLFGKQGSIGDTQYTQGAVDFVSTYGSTFSLATSTKTADDFLQDMSNYIDPRYNNAKATVFFCNTAVYNWLHKLGGFFSNNLNINSNFSADLAVTGRKKVLGLDSTQINTVYGTMNVVRNIHLDGSPIKMLAINMKHCKYRPLVGNGVNRDTSVYVGVQTLENSGVDRRVDLILTEAGMEWSMPETHAYWA